MGYKDISWSDMMYNLFLTKSYQDMSYYKRTYDNYCDAEHSVADTRGS